MVVPLVLNAPPPPVNVVPPKVTAPLAVRLPAPPSVPPKRLRVVVAALLEVPFSCSAPPVIDTVSSSPKVSDFATCVPVLTVAVLVNPLTLTIASLFAVGVPRVQLVPISHALLVAPVKRVTTEDRNEVELAP